MKQIIKLHIFPSRRYWSNNSNHLKLCFWHLSHSLLALFLVSYQLLRKISGSLAAKCATVFPQLIAKASFRTNPALQRLAPGFCRGARV